MKNFSTFIKSRISLKGAIISTASFLLLFIVTVYVLNFNVDDLMKRISAFIDPYGIDKEQAIPEDWLNRYNIVVSSEEDLLADIDNDGLNLKQEYAYLTDPKDPDTDKDGYDDGTEINNGYNPRGNGILDMDGDKLPDLWELKNGLDIHINDYGIDLDGDGLKNYQEYAHLTNPLNSDTDNDGYTDAQEINNGYDPTMKGDAKPVVEIVINKINVVAPVILSSSENEKDLLADLKDGVIRYPKTASPGQIGNMLLSGHSSNYAWIKGNYNYVFNKLNNLEAGDEISIKTTQANGKTLEYKYVVAEKDVVKPDDQRIFKKTQDSTLTLTTCWPLGTQWSRLMIKAKLI